MADLPRPDPSPDPSDPAAAESAAGQAERTERAFLDIVARMGQEPDQATWPEAEEVRLPPHPPVVVVRPARSAHPSTDPDAPTETDLRPIGDPEAGPAGQDGGDEGHYVPPPPPRAPRMRPATRAALVSMALGVAFLVAPALTGSEPSLAFETVAVMLVIGGVATLVARMREHPDPDDEPDDGAVV